MWAIIVTTAGSLHKQVAKALEPIVKSFPHSGQIAKIIFALGIIDIGLLAVPVLADSSAYVLSDAFGWKQETRLIIKSEVISYVFYCHLTELFKANP